MRFITNFLIKRSSNLIGKDEFGNEYFEHKKNNKRFILYNGQAEASKIPPNWHGWMHYTTDKKPTNKTSRKYSWQKTPIPNLTGTKNSYSPKNKESSKSSSNYQSWNPNK